MVKLHSPLKSPFSLYLTGWSISWTIWAKAFHSTSAHPLLPTPLPLPFWDIGSSPKWTIPTTWTEPLIWGAIVWWEQGSPHKWLVSLLLWSFTVCVELYGLLPYSPPISWWGLLNDYSDYYTDSNVASLAPREREGERKEERESEGGRHHNIMDLEGWLANTAGPMTVEGWKWAITVMGWWLLSPTNPRKLCTHRERYQQHLSMSRCMCRITYSVDTNWYVRKHMHQCAYLNNLPCIQPEVEVPKDKIWHLLKPLVSDPEKHEKYLSLNVNWSKWSCILLGLSVWLPQGILFMRCTPPPGGTNTCKMFAPLWITIFNMTTTTKIS